MEEAASFAKNGENSKNGDTPEDEEGIEVLDLSDGDRRGNEDELDDGEEESGDIEVEFEEEDDNAMQDEFLPIRDDSKLTFLEHKGNCVVEQGSQLI